MLREALPRVESPAEVHGVMLPVDTLEGVAQGDHTRIRQVLINLLSNAIKHNRAQGKVCLEWPRRGSLAATCSRRTPR